MRALSPGDVLYEGEVIVTEDNAFVDLKMADGSSLIFDGLVEVTLTNELLASSDVNVQEESLEDEDVTALLEALESGIDLNEVLEETAAGGSATSEGHSFVRLARITEDLTPFENEVPQFADIELVNLDGISEDRATGLDAGNSIPQDSDVTNISLSATDTVIEGGTITYTATLDNPADTVMTVILSNGEVITIAAGDTSGTVDVVASDDAFIGGDSASVTITSTSGGNFDNLVVDATPAITTINDDADETNLTLSATDTVSEGGTITYTATLDNPAGTAMTVTLSNGQVINIVAGATSGTVDVIASDDVYAGGDTASATIVSTSGGNFENLVVDNAPASTTISDDADESNLTLSATDTVTEGGTITYTATLDNPADTAMTVTLSNGEVINIAAGDTSGTVDVVTNNDVYAGDSSASASIVSSSGGNFENLIVDTSEATTTIVDSGDATNLTLTANDTVVEGGTITYTAILDNPADTAMTVTLSNGEVINIAAGDTSGTVDVVASDDVYEGGDTASATIASTSGGNFANLVVDSDAATTTVNDDADESNLTLSA
ncbi:retention module-containing protein, partial [Ketobacter sp.]